MIEFIYISFFFFKQKTAYEMRISDWSSDVCSSDLPVGAMEVIRDDALVGLDDVEQEITVADPRQLVLLLIGREAGHVIGIARFDRQQIGRASCRERVCQYV